VFIWNDAKICLFFIFGFPLSNASFQLNAVLCEWPRRWQAKKTFLYGDGRLDRRMRIVADEFEIFERQVVNVFDSPVQFHLGNDRQSRVNCSRLARDGFDKDADCQTCGRNRRLASYKLAPPSS
jgi:hypothetical protein